MKTRERLLRDRLSRMRQFLNDHAAALTAINQGRARTELDELLRALSERGDAQCTATQRWFESTARVHARTADLRTQHLGPIVAFAQVREDTGESPRFNAPTLSRLSPSVLAEIAVAIADMLRTDRKHYVAEGFPAGFVDHLRSAADAVRVAVDDQREWRAQRINATAHIQTLILRGRTLARVLDALVVAHVGTDGPLARAWRIAADASGITA